MAGNSTEQGIAADRKFVDNLYYHSKLSKDVKDGLEEGSHGQRMELCHRYLVVIFHCLEQVEEGGSARLRTDFLNYLRWNMEVIRTELEMYLEETHQTGQSNQIRSCLEELSRFEAKHLRMSEAEEGIVNECNHAFGIVSARFHAKAAEQAARLFMNYLNILQKKFYISEVGQKDVTFTEIHDQGEYISSKLMGINSKLANSVKNVLEVYKNYRMMDEALRKTQVNCLNLALELAHVRANETFLEQIRRELTETKEHIMTALRHQLEQIWDIAKLTVHPLTHPIETAKDIWYAVRHPLLSCQEVFKWARENPWKCAFVVLGGFALGGVIAVVGHLALPAAGAWAMLGVGVGTSIALPPLAIGSSKAAQVSLKAEMKKQSAEVKAAALMYEIKRKGKEIALEAMYEETKREFVREALKQAEEAKRLMTEAANRRREQNEERINRMNQEELSAALDEVEGHERELCREIAQVRKEVEAKGKRQRASCFDQWKISEGLEAAKRVMEDACSQNGVKDRNVHVEPTAKENGEETPSDHD